jgi:SHS2 domain-containing protein
VNSAHAMVNYMYDRESVQVSESREITIEGINRLIIKAFWSFVNFVFRRFPNTSSVQLP